MESCLASRLKEALQIAQQSEDLIVGDEPSTYNTICEVVASSKSAGIIWSKLIDIARALEISEDRVQKIKVEVNSKTGTHESLLYYILESWRGSKGRDAKLTTFMSVLKRKGVKDCADTLRNHFGVRYYPCLAFSDIIESTTWEDLSDGLKLQILGKEVYFHGKKTELAEALGNYDMRNIDGSFLLALANGNTPTLVTNQLHDDLNYYIHRSVKQCGVMPPKFHTGSYDNNVHSKRAEALKEVAQRSILKRLFIRQLLARN